MQNKTQHPGWWQKNKAEIILILSVTGMLWALGVFSLEVVLRNWTSFWQWLGWSSVAGVMAASVLGWAKNRRALGNYRLWGYGIPLAIGSSLVGAVSWFVLLSLLSAGAL